jgi:hypothetical protein
MSTDQSQKAKALVEAMHAAGRRLLDAKRPPPATAGSTPLMNVLIAVHPTSEVTVAKEIELVKSALLYADHVTLCSPVYELLACMAALAQSDSDTQMQLIAELVPIIQPENALLAQTIKQLIGKGSHRNLAELIQYQKLKRELPAQWKPMAEMINKFYREAGATELQEPISEGILDLDFLELRNTTTDEVVQGFMRRLQEYLTDARAYPMFDDKAGNLVRVGLDAGAFTVTAEAMRRASNAGLGTGLIDRLPSFPAADMRAVLETRAEVEQYVGKFRHAVAKLRDGIASSPLDDEFAEEVDTVFVSEVRSAVEDIQSALGSSSFGKRLIAQGKAQVTSGALALGVVAAQQWPLLVKIAVGGTAAAVSAAAANQSASSAQQQAQGNDLFFLYRTELELDQRS